MGHRRGRDHRGSLGRAIIEQPLPKPYAFDAPETLIAALVAAMEHFTADLIALLSACA